MCTTATSARVRTACLRIYHDTKDRFLSRKYLEILADFHGGDTALALRLCVCRSCISKMRKSGAKGNLSLLLDLVSQVDDVDLITLAADAAAEAFATAVRRHIAITGVAEDVAIQQLSEWLSWQRSNHD